MLMVTYTKTSGNTASLCVLAGRGKIRRRWEERGRGSQNLQKFEEGGREAQGRIFTIR